MIFITGDTHGDWMTRLNRQNFPEQNEMTKDDYVIICGDFGLWHDTPQERHYLDWLDKKPFTTLFVDGNHENFDRLYDMPVEEWHGGKVHKIRNSVIHLMRGQVFDINGQSFFTFGGASSHDISDGILEKDDPRLKKWRKDYTKFFRINHVSWWAEELPSQKEMDEGLANLQKHNNRVNYIITHSPYTSIMKYIGAMSAGKNSYKPDMLTDYLQKIKDNTHYGLWIFGHMHDNCRFPWDKSACLFEQIVRLF